MWTLWSAVDVMMSESVRAPESNLITYCVFAIRGIYGAKVRDPVECTDRDNDLIVHMGKEMDMFQLERDFNVSAWAYGQPADIRMLVTVDHEIKMFVGIPIYVARVALAYIDWRRQMVHSLLGGRGGAQLVTEEPSLSRRSPALRSKMGGSYRDDEGKPVVLQCVGKAAALIDGEFQSGESDLSFVTKSVKLAYGENYGLMQERRVAESLASIEESVRAPIGGVPEMFSTRIFDLSSYANLVQVMLVIHHCI
ncbi:hypothetical protein Syun_029510 [Stephania yunnanensis]|uniref:Uncharacterized protein n=1 Tax=Stephania yunnanensis TaxID=152371 RepID=A0AAP0E5R7_9MAGN